MPDKDPKPVTITAESGKGKDDGKAKKLKKSEEEMKEDNMSEEDKELKERLEICVSTVVNEKNEDNVTIPIRLTALDVIVNELRTATSSMTSVPKPLKFLRPHFGTLKTLYLTVEKTGASTMDKDALEFRARLADVLAVLAMTMGKPGTLRKKNFDLYFGHIMYPILLVLILSFVLHSFSHRGPRKPQIQIVGCQRLRYFG
jgi:26S proteasome regulatory subunit N1